MAGATPFMPPLEDGSTVAVLALLPLPPPLPLPLAGGLLHPPPWVLVALTDIVGWVGMVAVLMFTWVSPGVEVFMEVVSGWNSALREEGMDVGAW